jgi:hypothetical protein
MLGKDYARCPSDRHWFSAGSVILVAALLSALLLPSPGYPRNPKQAARTSSVRKKLPKCAPTEGTLEKDIPKGSAVPSNATPEATDESRVPDSLGSDSMKLGSTAEGDVQSSEHECAPSQTGTVSVRCRATKSKNSTLECIQNPALKPDLALDREPAN